MLVTEWGGGASEFDYEDLYDACLVEPVGTKQLVRTSAELMELRTRRSPRVPLETLVSLDGVMTRGERALANSINISEHGLLVETAAPLDIGARGRALFVLPDGDARLNMAVIVRVAMDEVRLHYALEFEAVAAADRRRIESFVAETGEP